MLEQSGAYDGMPDTVEPDVDVIVVAFDVVVTLDVEADLDVEVAFEVEVVFAAEVVFAVEVVFVVEVVLDVGVVLDVVAGAAGQPSSSYAVGLANIVVGFWRAAV